MPRTFSVVLVTVPDMRTALALARDLVRSRLAACVNLSAGLVSIYRWKGKVERAGEILLIAKTRKSRVAALARRVQEMHPYETPEILALPVESGSRSYLRWLRESVA
jgi:periplasmic divalent cation tolerance protein